MAAIPQLISGNAIDHGIAMFVDHGGTGSAKMYVGGQAQADVAAGTTVGGAAGTTETDLSELTIPANSLVAGSTIRARFIVVASAIAAGTDNLVVALRFGTSTTGSSNQSVIANAAFDVNTAADFSIGDVIIQIRTAGSSGTAIAWGTLTMPDSAAAVSPLQYYTASFAVDTTSANYVTVTGDWSNTDANLCTTQGFVVDIVNPST